MDAVSAVEAACFPPAEAASKDEFYERLTYYANHFWLLFEGDTLISFVDGMVTDETDLTDDMYARAAIFGVNTIPSHRQKGYAGRLIQVAIDDARRQGRRGLVLTCKDRLIHYYSGFGFIDEGVSSKSVHGGAVWHQMRLTF